MFFNFKKNFFRDYFCHQMINLSFSFRYRWADVMIGVLVITCRKYVIPILKKKIIIMPMYYLITYIIILLLQKKMNNKLDYFFVFMSNHNWIRSLFLIIILYCISRFFFVSFFLTNYNWLCRTTYVYQIQIGRLNYCTIFRI